MEYRQTISKLNKAGYVVSLTYRPNGTYKVLIKLSGLAWKGEGLSKDQALQAAVLELQLAGGTY